MSEREAEAADLRAWLDGCGVSQAQVARRLQMNKATLSLILSGKQRQPCGFPLEFRAAVRAIAQAEAYRLLRVAVGEESPPFP